MVDFLRCADNLSHPMILGLIWDRITEENRISAESTMSEIQDQWLKESQFYMGCKLVALYQQQIDKINSEDPELTIKDELIPL